LGQLAVTSPGSRPEHPCSSPGTRRACACSFERAARRGCGAIHTSSANPISASPTAATLPMTASSTGAWRSAHVWAASRPACELGTAVTFPRPAARDGTAHLTGCTARSHLPVSLASFQGKRRGKERSSLRRREPPAQSLSRLPPDGRPAACRLVDELASEYEVAVRHRLSSRGLPRRTAGRSGAGPRAPPAPHFRCYRLRRVRLVRPAADLRYVCSGTRRRVTYQSLPTAGLCGALREVERARKCDAGLHAWVHAEQSRCVAGIHRAHGRVARPRKRTPERTPDPGNTTPVTRKISK